MQDPIIITGCARSFTSLTAGIIHHCGAFGGKMVGPSPRLNPKGFFENVVIRNQIIKPFLRKLGADPLGQLPLPAIDRVPRQTDLRERIQTVMKSEGYRGGPWFFKVVKGCLIWPALAEAFPDARWIIVHRDKEEIAESCLNADFMRAYNTLEDWIWWVEQYQDRLEQIAGDPDTDVEHVWPAKMVYEDDFQEMKEIVEWAGLQWNEEKVRDFVIPRAVDIANEEEG